MTATVYIRYAVVFLGVAIGVALLVTYLNETWDSALGSSAQILVPAMIASVVEGGQFAKRERRKPTGREAWNFAFAAMLVATALNVVLAYAAAEIVPEFGKLAIAPAGSEQFLIVLGLYAGGYLLCNRFFISIGAGNQVSLLRGKDETDR